MMRKLLIVGLLLVSNIVLNAQTDFRDGYIITNLNDTLYGKIDYRGDILMGKVCKFNLNDNITEYLPFEIVAYRFIDDGKYFVSKEINGKNVFLEFLIKGEINIYYGRDEDKFNRYYIEKAGLTLSELPYDEKAHYLSTEYIQLKKTKKHIGLLTYYMQDTPELWSQIESLKVLDHNSLLQLAQNYHYAACTDGVDCIIFEKKKSAIKISAEIVFGILDFYYDNKIHGHGGALLNIWMPRANEKIFFRTGLLYTTNDYMDGIDTEYQSQASSTWKIPLMFEYRYPKSIIRPKAGYGLGLLLNKWGLGVETSFMVGCNIVVNQA